MFEREGVRLAVEGAPPELKSGTHLDERVAEKEFPEAYRNTGPCVVSLQSERPHHELRGFGPQPHSLAVASVNRDNTRQVTP